MSSPHRSPAPPLRALFALLLTLPLAASVAHADFAQAADKIRDSVVTVSVEKRMGAGFIVNGEGYVLTNRHVMDKATAATIKLANGDELPATLVQASTTLDLLLLKVDRPNLPAVTFASSSKLKQGGEVAALGAPFGLSDTLTKGIVSSPSREIDGKKYLQIDAALNQGNSGGPVINDKGLVVGVATLVAKKAENLGFAIPSDDVMTFLNEAKITFSTLDALPVAATTPATPPAAGVPATPATPAAPTPLPPAPPAPAPSLLQPWMWLVLSAIVAFVVALITSLVVAKSAAREQAPAQYAAPQYPAPSWGGAPAPAAPTPAPAPAPRAAEDLSDIDIELR